MILPSDDLFGCSIACSRLSDSGGEGTRTSKRNRAGSGLVLSPPLFESLEEARCSTPGRPGQLEALCFGIRDWTEKLI